MIKTQKSENDEYKVLIVEDHPMFRDQLVQLIEREPGLSVCGTADCVNEALARVEETRPDIAIVDLSLRGSSGLEFIKDIKSRGINMKMLVLSMHDEDLYAERVLRAGAQGYITKNEASTEVIKAICCVMNGEVYASAQLTARLLGKMSGKGVSPDLERWEKLSDRELEVFQMLGRGKDSREIAAALNLSHSTVETYRSRIREKLQLRSPAELYLFAGQWERDHGS